MEHKQRKLTVIARWYDNESIENAHSEIRLKGKWLMDAGFFPGDTVHVIVEDNKLIIHNKPY